MLSPTAFELLIKYFDGVDSAVARRLSRKRPWLETALTSLLCDLLDDETQEDEPLDYTLGALNTELRALDGLVEVHVRLETHEYPPAVERWVTQSDLGFVLEFNDLLLPDESWTASWLLQAKRLYPQSRNPLRYSESSSFDGVDAEQKKRIDQLVQQVGLPFIKYLLYCPRPIQLDDATRLKLTYLRNRTLSGNIFDYTPGLQIHRELGLSDNSLAAGLFVVSPDELPNTFGQVHSQVLNGVTPFSWFLAQQFAGGRPEVGHRNHDERLRRRPDAPDDDGPDYDWAHGIVTGDPCAVDRVLTVFQDRSQPIPFLPPHTLTVGVSIGRNIDPNERRIRLG